MFYNSKHISAFSTALSNHTTISNDKHCNRDKYNNSYFFVKNDLMLIQKFYKNCCSTLSLFIFLIEYFYTCNIFMLTESKIKVQLRISK